MAMTFANAMRQQTEVAATENGAKAFNTTKNPLLDMFGVVGALRSREDSDITKMYAAAFAEDKLLATKLAFYARNVRGGLGERDTSRILFKYLAYNHPEIMRKNLHLVPSFGRWDDMYEFIGTPVEADMWKFVDTQLRADLRNYQTGKPVSLMAKWLKSANGEGETRKYGLQTAKALSLTERQYRKILSALRAYLKVIEPQMSAKQWDTITYDAVPSYAMKRYRSAFARHDNVRFSNYLSGVVKGTRKINASTMYPYDLVQPYLTPRMRKDEVLEAQWKVLPNYVKKGENVLVMADVSGSMESSDGRPMATSIGLALYFAQRNTGAYKNLYMTFTNRPSFIQVNPVDSLADNVRKVRTTDIGYSTNLEAAFRAVLKLAVDNQVPVDEMPKAIVVISDMEINSYMQDSPRAGWGFIDQMESMYSHHGYKMPKMVMWNCEARQNTFLAQSNNPNVQFFSGNSAATFRDVLSCIGYNAYDAMVKTLSNPMYDCIAV